MAVDSAAAMKIVGRRMSVPVAFDMVKPCLIRGPGSGFGVPQKPLCGVAKNE
ncbi:hypothetical protein [Nitratifractor sp.]